MWIAEIRDDRGHRDATVKQVDFPEYFEDEELALVSCSLKDNKVLVEEIHHYETFRGANADGDGAVGISEERETAEELAILEWLEQERTQIDFKEIT